jgi:hypothetical protein
MKCTAGADDRPFSRRNDCHRRKPRSRIKINLYTSASFLRGMRASATPTFVSIFRQAPNIC